MITVDQLLHVMPHAGLRAATYAQPLTDAMQRFDITTRLRVAAFLAQIAVESGELRYTSELWEPTPAQVRYARRADLGNTRPLAFTYAHGAGETDVGKFYRGHGLIQITGFNNHLSYSIFRYGDDRCARHPELLTEPDDAAMSAGWYWQTHNCAAPAAAGDIDRVSRIVNGGDNGLAERRAAYRRALDALPDFANVVGGSESTA